MSYLATDEREKAKLRDYTSPEGRGDLYRYNQKENRTVLEVSNVFIEDCLYHIHAIQILACKVI